MSLKVLEFYCKMTLKVLEFYCGQPVWTLFLNVSLKHIIDFFQLNIILMTFYKDIG